MASYEVIPKPSVEKDLRSLPKSAIGRVLKRMKGLATNLCRAALIGWKEAKVYTGFALETIELSTESIAMQRE